MDEPTKIAEVKKQQRRNALVLGGVSVVMVWGAFYLLDQHHPAHLKKQKVTSIEFASPLGHVDRQGTLLADTQNAIKRQQDATEDLKKQVTNLKTQHESDQKMTDQTTKTLDTLNTRLNALAKQLEYSRETVPEKITVPVHENLNFMNEDHLQLVSQLKPIAIKPAKNPDTFVPAGTFVRAILLGGADASAGVTSQGDPTPTLFRILDDGTLPNHQHSHLKNCVATAAAVGDISSERGEIRLERLSCTKLNGEVIELPVEATVFGPDGKNGVRGRPLWREGALLQRAFAAGALSGISSGIAQSYTQSSATPWGPVQTIDNGHILQYGLASGARSAAEKLADYNIRRAEQYHPVIQLSAGIVVDIVFLKGFYWTPPLPENETHQEVSALTEVSAPPEFPDTSLKSLPLSDAQLEKLRLKNTEAGYQNDK